MKQRRLENNAYIIFFINWKIFCAGHVKRNLLQRHYANTNVKKIDKCPAGKLKKYVYRMSSA